MRRRARPQPGFLARRNNALTPNASYVHPSPPGFHLNSPSRAVRPHAAGRGDRKQIPTTPGEFAPYLATREPVSLAGTPG